MLKATKNCDMSNEQRIMVSNERIDIYRDFTLLLTKIVYDYYLDPESLSTDDDIFNHFNFCYQKACDKYLKEDINFKNNTNLKSYFYGYFYNQFYKIKINDFKYYEKFWITIFNEKTKSKSSMAILIELYNFFDLTLNNKL